MPITATPRPTFLLRSTLEAAGGPRPSSLPAGFRPSQETVEKWWQAMEPLIGALTLAGYECPEIALARGATTAAYTRLLCWPGTEDQNSFVVESEEDWTEITGSTADWRIFQRIFLRVTPRRSLLEPANLPSPLPPLPLGDLLPNFVQPDSAGPGDGWIAYDQVKLVLPEQESETPGTFAPDARATANSIIDALVDAFEQNRPPLGILGLLNPANWDSALGADLTVEPFAGLAADIWTWLLTADNLRVTLKRDPADSAASFGSLHAYARLVTSVPADAVSCLEARRMRFHPKDAKLELTLAGIEKQHYLGLLYLLHEYGLIRLFPFQVTSSIFLPPADQRAFPPVDLTGAYITPREQFDAEGNPKIPVIATLQLNQAGDYVEGWWADGELRRTNISVWLDSTTYDPAHGVTGPLVFTGTNVSLLDVPATDATAITIRVQLGSIWYGMTRVDRRARLAPDVYAEALPPDVAANLTTSIDALVAPLHIRAKEGLDEAVRILLADIQAMAAGQKDYSGIGDTARRVRDALYFNGVISTRNGEPAVTPMLERMRTVVHRELVANDVARDETCLEQLQAIIANQPAVSLPLQQLLAIGVSDHSYSYTMWAVGYAADVESLGGAELGVFGFTMPLTHASTCGTEPHGWPAKTYLGALWQGGVSAGIGASAKFKFFDTGSDNTAITQVEWNEDDWANCAFVVAEYSATVSAFAGEFAPATPEWVAKATGLEGTEVEDFIFIGRKGRSVAIGHSSGWAATAGPVFGMSASIGLTGKLGAILGYWGASRIVRPKEVLTFREELKPGTEIELEAFDQDRWELKPWMLIALQRSVARYRALFEAPAAALDIEGDASTTAPVEHNEALSWKRALSAYAWIRALLSTAPVPLRPPLPQGQPRPPLGTTSGLSIDPDRVSISGTGELRARIEGIADEVEIADWRQVVLSINDQALVIM